MSVDCYYNTESSAGSETQAHSSELGQAVFVRLNDLLDDVFYEKKNILQLRVNCICGRGTAHLSHRSLY